MIGKPAVSGTHFKEGAFDAVSGPDLGKKIEFTSEPLKMALKDWIKEHPETTILLPPQR